MSLGDFGRDVTTTTEGMVTGRLSSGLRLVAEAIVRRLTTAKGELPGGREEADYGLDVQSCLGADMGPGELAAVKARIESEVRKDPRVSRAVANVVFDGLGMQIDLECGTNEGPFELVMRATETSVEVIGVRL
jgi:hypothetical protein